MKYLERLSTQQTLALIKELKISRREDENKMPFAIVDGKLHIIHGKNSEGEKIESILEDYEIVQIYNTEPSKYDQRRYQNFMSDELEKYNYRKDLIEYLTERYEDNAKE